MAQSKLNEKLLANSLEAMELIDKTFHSLIAEFGSIEMLKPADSYLLGVLRTAQSGCLYAYGFVQDVHRQSTKAVVKRPVDPNLKPDID
jgi:hypothetical protein